MARARGGGEDKGRRSVEARIAVSPEAERAADQHRDFRGPAVLGELS
ncbi:MAG TPA: hypothetical protein VHN16_08990 [Streptosporangiaceae bacterium]|nr:hypothetical protein [Streptosporangiaceae bacterium]